MKGTHKMADYKQPATIKIMLDADPDKTDIQLIPAANIKATLSMSTDLTDLLQHFKFVQRGRNAWSHGITGANNIGQINGFINSYAQQFIPNTLGTKLSFERNATGNTRTGENGLVASDHMVSFASTMTALTKRGKTVQGRGPAALPNNTSQHLLHHASSLRHSLPRMGIDVTNYPVTDNWSNERARILAGRGSTKFSEYSTLGMVELNVQPRAFWVRLIPVNSVYLTYKDAVETAYYFTKDNHHYKVFQEYNTVPHVPAHMLGELFKDIPEKLRPLFFEGNYEYVSKLIALSDKKIIAGAAPNQPAKVLLHVGASVPQEAKLTRGLPAAGKSHLVSISEALNLQRKYSDDFVIHESLTDIVNMDKAKPYKKEPRLKSYQKEAVGLHLSTSIGYLQACSPGMGKTIIQLAAMRARSKEIKNYRALVVSESNVKVQWKEEAQNWFPEANIYILSKGSDVDGLAKALATVDAPVVIIMSYTHSLTALDAKENRDAIIAKAEAITSYTQKLEYWKNLPVQELTVGDMLLDTHWHDICADEAMIIRNGTSKQSQILWELRKNSDIATALTATPINKSPDDIGRLLAWVRNDKHLFSGVPLSEQYKTTTEAGGKALFEVFGPLVFRRDISEIADEMPENKPKVTLVDANPNERALISAAENELKRCYLELTAALDEVEAAGTQTAEELALAKEQLKAANGAWLGGKQLARMAASDPAALLESESVGAALLNAQGLVENALLNTPTKRRVFVEQVTNHVKNGKQVVVFTDFKTVATLLKDTLEENGIRASTYSGTNTNTRDRARIRFQNGDLDVLICTKAGERGLTLHRASVIINFDLPWVLERVIQRAGRGIRLGSKNSTVEVEYLVVKDTLEQAIAEHIVELAASSLFVLDKARGVDVTQTETAQAVSGLVAAFGNKASRDDLKELRDLLVK